MEYKLIWNNKPCLDNAALKWDFLWMHFAQMSSEVASADTFSVVGVTLKVLSTVPAEGGVFDDGTQFVCKGIALKEHLPKPTPQEKDGASELKAT